MRDPRWVFTDRDGAITSVVYQTPVTIGRDKTGKVVVDDRRKK